MNGGLTEEEFNTEKEKILNNEKKDIKISFNAILVTILIILIVAGIGLYLYFNNLNQKGEVKEEKILNSQAGTLSERSFKKMQSYNEEYSNIQQDILNYFDNDYFNIDGSEVLKKYPQIFKNTKIEISLAKIEKIIKSTNEEFEALITCGEGYNINETGSKIEYIIRGKQLEERVAEDEYIQILGRYNDINTYQIDGTSYTVPTIDIINISREERFGLTTIKNVAKYIFGNNIKITEEDDDMIEASYTIILDDQSNVNFKAFDMSRDEGYIAYNSKYNNLSGNVSKSLCIAADFEHFIVKTIDRKLNQIYIDYYDKNFNKLWGREFNCKSTTVSPMDYNAKTMAKVVDNDLYLINLENGENIIEPIIVGEKMKINMVEDGIILFGDENKDTIMKVSFDGKIIFKVNADMSMAGLRDINTQFVEDRLIVKLLGDMEVEGSTHLKPIEKYMVIDKNGNVESSTREFESAY